MPPPQREHHLLSQIVLDRPHILQATLPGVFELIFRQMRPLDQVGIDGQDRRQALRRHRAAERCVGDRHGSRRIRAKVFQIRQEPPAVALAGPALGHFAGEIAQAELPGRFIRAARRHEQGKRSRFQPVHLLGDERQAIGELVGVNLLRHGRLFKG